VTHALTLDVGGSHVTAALVALTDRRVERQARRNVLHSAPQAAIVEAWTQAALDALGAFGGPLSHWGVAVPSPFEHAAGCSRMTHKFPALLGVPLRPLLETAVQGTPLSGLPVRFGNDADLFALGEWWAGAGRGSDRIIGLTLGTGLGSGFISGGQVVTNGRDVPPDGELWNVPFRGGLSEDFTCGAALTRAWASLTGETLSAYDLAQQAETGDGVACAVFAAFGGDLAAVLQPWTERFAAERVVLGGNVSRAFALFVPALRGGLPGCDVRLSEQFERAGLLGAAALTH